MNINEVTDITILQSAAYEQMVIANSAQHNIRVIEQRLETLRAEAKNSPIDGPTRVDDPVRQEAHSAETQEKLFKE